MPSLDDQLSNLDVENVFIYVADAVREDYLPECIATKGITATGIASSTYSPPSFSSIASGVYPPSHGVHWFSHQLPLPPVFDVESVNTYYHSTMYGMEGTSDSFFRVFDLSPDRHHSVVQDCEPPFIAIERGSGGHAPYRSELSAPEYFRKYAGESTNTIRSHYRNRISEDAENFESRIDALAERDLLEDTLVIYTSDHGELLGEGGQLGHNAPMRPELVYVPFVFSHPELDTSLAVDGVIRHVDLLPTVLDLLNADVGDSKRFDGHSLSAQSPADSGLTFFHRQFFSTPFSSVVTGKLEYRGVWDESGGCVFTSASMLDRLGVLAGKAVTSSKRKYLAKHSLAASRSYLRGDFTYGSPNFDLATATELIDTAVDSEAKRDEHSLSKESKENLEDLGYL